uniref:Ig-like domain-containing protein n=1 Tax=Anopheles maculatus TaxID=74869 RepID=A0A182T8W7_9DIPT
RPQPSVKWLINGILVDEQYEHNSGDVIENRLLWPAIQRSDLNSIFTCQATNTLLVEPKESSFVLDLHRKSTARNGFLQQIFPIFPTSATTAHNSANQSLHQHFKHLSNPGAKANVLKRCSNCHPNSPNQSPRNAPTNGQKIFSRDYDFRFPTLLPSDDEFI